jgi:alpha-tubulin suppressor-like RCC1 family protein
MSFRVAAMAVLVVPCVACALDWSSRAATGGPDAAADGCMSPREFYADVDQDGFGDRARSARACEPPEGYVENADDCADDCAACRPRGAELCDDLGRDENCNGQSNEGCSCEAQQTASCGPLMEVGECVTGQQACGPDLTWGTCEGAVHPQDELCDGKDNDCDSQTDEHLLNSCGECGEVPGETCNGHDDDCDGETDEGTAAACAWKICGEASSSAGTVDESACARVVEIAAGGKHTCARTNTGAVYCWGENFQGQLGNGDNGQTSRNTPQRVVGVGGAGFLDGVLGITAGFQHTCARLSGSIVCWGKNDKGQLANSGAGAWSSVPVISRAKAGVSLASARQVDAGDEFVCALLASQEVACWGTNQQAQLGDGGSGVDASMAQRVLSEDGSTQPLTGVTQLSAGGNASCVLRGGRVWCWGQNAWGAVGNGEISLSEGRPTAVVKVAGTGDGPLESIASVSAGGDFACALQLNQQVVCWGANFWGALGSAQSETGMQTGTPFLADGEGGPGAILQNAAELRAGHGGTVCARLSNGFGVCWGGNFQGQVGDGTFGSANHREHPVAVLAAVGTAGRMMGIVSMAAGVNHSCALLDSGDVACWGMNDVGQLGNGEFVTRMARAVLVHTPD